MWILFAVLAAFFWAINNIVDKFVLTKWVKQPFVPVIILGLIGFIAAMIVFFSHGITHLSGLGIFLAFAAGISYVLMNVFYFRALQLEEVSRVSPMFYVAPLIILLFATIFLGEVFTPLKYLGIFLLVAGAILISSKDILKFRFSKAVWWMLLSAFALAINQILTKYLLGLTDFWTVFFYIRIGTLVAVVPIICIYLPELIRNIRQHGGRVLALISGNETLNIFGVLLFTIAISVGSVTLVNALSSVQQFFVLFIAVILSIFYPLILKEEIGKSTLALKLFAILSMFVGVILVT